MPTGAIPGFNAKLAVSTDGGSVYNDIGEMRDVTLTVEADEIDATSKDSAGWREFLEGLTQWGGTAEGLWLDVNTGQDAVYNALVAKTTVMLRLRPKTGAGLDQYIGTAIITGYEVANPLDDAVAVNITFRGTGALAKSAQ